MRDTVLDACAGVRALEIGFQEDWKLPLELFASFFFFFFFFFF